MKILAKNVAGPGGESKSLLTEVSLLLWWAPFLLSCGYVALTPFADALSSLHFYDTKRLLQIGLLLVGAFCVAGVPCLRAGWMATFRALPTVARWGLSTVVVLGVASALMAPMPRYGLMEVAHLVLLFNLGLVAASLCRAFPGHYVQGLLGVAVGGAALYLAFVFVPDYVQHVAGTLGAPLWPGGEIGYGNRRFFNHVQAWSLPLLVVPALIPVLRRVQGMRTGIFAVTACWWMLLWASNGSGILLSMIVALLGVAIVFRKQGRPWIWWQVATGGSGYLLYVLFFQVIAAENSSLAGRAANKISRVKTGNGLGRLTNWQQGIEKLAQEPWLGLGPMHTAYYPNELWHTTHNAVIQFFAEWGVLAGTLLLGLALWGLWSWCGSTRRRVSATSASEDETEGNVLLEVAQIALTGSLLAAGANSMVSGVVVMPSSQMMMVLVLGGTLGLHLSAHVPVPSEKICRTQWALVAFLVAGASVLVWAVAPDAFHLSERTAAWIFEKETLWLAPRYWCQGAFGM